MTMALASLGAEPAASHAWRRLHLPAGTRDFIEIRLDGESLKDLAKASLKGVAVGRLNL